MSAAHTADRLACSAVLMLRTPVRLSADRLVSTSCLAGLLSRRVSIVPSPRYKSNLERPLSTGSRSIETVKPDYRATATRVAIGGAVLGAHPGADSR
eukprot:7067192-Prymnesium_polylepis.1